MRRIHVPLVVVSGILAFNGVEAAPDARQLGPTGLYGAPSATEIRIAKVAKGSPADGLVTTRDVIVGAGGAAFRTDARREIADAIDAAETEAAKGILPLTLKGGKTVNLQLKILGRYSQTAPYNCPKTEAIITQAAEYLVKSGHYAKGGLHSGWLGLMATGEKKYLDVVRQNLPKQKWVSPDTEAIAATLRGDKDMGYVGWYWGYDCITLGEYYLLTGDQSVLPALETYAVALAKGQDAGGLWGHRMATTARNGRLPGYAQMNQNSLTCFMGMLMARKCGIRNPDLDRGIGKTYAFYATFIGQGTLNYGVHGPNTKTFNNNGTSATAALDMALAGNREGVDFFSRLSAASWDGLETGHATFYFNVMWTPLGAHLAGPEVTQQFFRQSRWLHTLYRAWDGSFTFDGGESGEGNSSGAHLLAYCLGRRALFITGKEADKRLWLKGKEAAAAIEVGRIDYASKSADELIALFGHPLPQVTRSAVWALRAHEPKSDCIPRLATMMKKGTKAERLSAIGYFGYGCSNATALARLDDLGAILRDPKEDPERRALAASALSFIGKPAYPYYMDMARIIVEEEPGDVFRATDESVGNSMVTLCATPFKDGLVTDKPLFYRAALKLADHKRQSARTSGMRLIAEVPLADFHLVADKVQYIMDDKDPTYHSYHNQGPRGAAIDILVALHIAEGLEYLLDTLQLDSGKYGFKIRMMLEVVPKFGGNAKAALPRLKTINAGKFQTQWDAMIRTIEQGEPGKEKLMSFEEARQYGVKKPSAPSEPLKEMK